MKPARSLAIQPAFRQALPPGAWGVAPQAQAVLLESRAVRLEIVPGLAGGIAALTWQGARGPVPVLRLSGAPDAGVLYKELACRPLVQTLRAASHLSASGCGAFEVAHASENNPWRITHADQSSVSLLLECDGSHPYRLWQTVTLADACVRIRLELINTGRRAQALGLGLACSVARDHATWLAAAAGGIWCATAADGTLRHLPAPPAWRFGLAYPLPATHLEHAFSEWAGVARVHWPRQQLALTISGDSNGYVLSTPQAGACFGFHPLDCAPDHKMRNARPRGAQRLARGASLVREFALTLESGEWQTSLASGA